MAFLLLFFFSSFIIPATFIVGQQKNKMCIYLLFMSVYFEKWPKKKMAIHRNCFFSLTQSKLCFLLAREIEIEVYGDFGLRDNIAWLWMLNWCFFSC